MVFPLGFWRIRIYNPGERDFTEIWVLSASFPSLIILPVLSFN